MSSDFNLTSTPRSVSLRRLKLSDVTPSRHFIVQQLMSSNGQEVRLHFTPAEATFYSTIRDDGRKARNQLQELLLQGGHTEYREHAARRRAEVPNFKPFPPT